MGYDKDAPPGVSTSLFDLDDAKTRVVKELSSTLPAACKRFVASEEYDALARTAILHFVACFQLDSLNDALARARKQHQDDFNPIAVDLKVTELHEEAERHRAALSPIYAQIIMRYSSYKHPNRDRLFFEGLYITLVNLCDAAFAPLAKRDDLETRIGELFRSRHFNLYARRNAPPRSVDTLSVKELHAIKHDTANRTLNAKLISKLHERPSPLRVQAASVNNSPLISGFITSPITARAIMKDPKLRNELCSDVGPSRAVKPKAAETSNGVAGSGPAADKATAAPGALGRSGLSISIPNQSGPFASQLSSLELATPTIYPPSTRGGKLAFSNASSVRTDAPSRGSFKGTGDAAGERYIGPGFEHLLSLYDERMAMLDDLRGYLHTGVHPREELRNKQRRLAHSESMRSLASRSFSCSPSTTPF